MRCASTVVRLGGGPPAPVERTCARSQGSRSGVPLRPWSACGPATVVFDSSLTAYDFGPAHPMSPIRVDLTMRLAARPRRARPAARWCRRRSPTTTLIATVHDARADRRGARAPARTRTRSRSTTTASAPTTTRCSPTCTSAAAHVVGASLEAVRQVWSGESLHSANIAGGLHHAMPRPGERLLHLQRRRGRHPAGCSTRAPSGSRTSTSTCTTATASRRSSTTTRGC